MPKLRVFEAFSGIGAQHMALNNTNINFEVIGTSDIDVNAIIGYASIHCPDFENIQCPNYEFMLNHLQSLNIGYDFKKQKSTLNSIKPEKLEQLYKATIASNNFGDISLINSTDIPEHDLLTYSFPCQDISSVGTMLSCAENSNTRSSLLWECKKIISEKSPRYLLLENVKNLISGKHRPHLDLWLDWLSEQGYKNEVLVLDSLSFNVPQRRPRVFVLSTLDDNLDLNSLNPIPLTNDITNILEENIDFKEYEPPGDRFNVDEININEGELKFLDDRDWRMNGLMVSNVCSTQRAGRTGLKCIKKENNQVLARRLTTLECWRLMGFNDDDFNKINISGISHGQILKLCGNSIVAPVLQHIFNAMINQEYRKK